MPRKKRGSNKTALARFILNLHDQQRKSYRSLAETSGCSVSTVHAWATGGLPCESITALKRLTEFYGVPLSVALTGSPENLVGPMLTSIQFREVEVFNGLARIQVTKLIERENGEELV